MNQKIIANKLKVKNIIVLDDKLYQVRKTEHVKPGKGGAFVQAELQGVGFSQKINKRFRSEEVIDKAMVEEREASFLYEDQNECVFMFDNGEQVSLNKKEYPLCKFLTDGMDVKLEMHEEEVIGIKFLQEKITVKIESADLSIKGQTASSSFKNAILENGEKVMVPPYIESGDQILINPETLEYAGRS